MAEEPDPDNFDELMEALPWSLRSKILARLRGEEVKGETNEPELTVDEIKEMLPKVPPLMPYVPIIRYMPEDFAEEMRVVFRDRRRRRTKRRRK